MLFKKFNLKKNIFFDWLTQIFRNSTWGQHINFLFLALSNTSYMHFIVRLDGHQQRARSWRGPSTSTCFRKSTQVLRGTIIKLTIFYTNQRCLSNLDKRERVLTISTFGMLRHSSELTSDRSPICMGYLWEVDGLLCFAFLYHQYHSS